MTILVVIFATADLPVRIEPEDGETVMVNWEVVERSLGFAAWLRLAAVAEFVLEV